MICFEHGFEYDGVDTLMCTYCETEIAAMHDPWYEEEEEECEQ